MSLGAELAFARLAGLFSRRGPVVIWSEFGVAAPVAACGASVLRLAERPLCGLVREPFRGFCPAASTRRAPADAVRLASAGSLMLHLGDQALTSYHMNRFDRPPIVLRAVAGDGLEAVPEGYEKVYDDDEERIFIIASEGAVAREAIALFAPERRDELDTLAVMIGRGPVTGLRHSVDAAEMLYDPITVVDAPDEGQIGAAIGEGRAMMDAEGGAALVIPIVTLAAPVGFDLIGLPESATPRIHGATMISTERRGTVWRARLGPGEAAEAVQIEVEDAPGAEITEVWAGVCRRRAAWEAWDEAEARMALEESW